MSSESTGEDANRGEPDRDDDAFMELRLDMGVADGRGDGFCCGCMDTGRGRLEVVGLAIEPDDEGLVPWTDSGRGVAVEAFLTRGAGEGPPREGFLLREVARVGAGPLGGEGVVDCRLTDAARVGLLLVDGLGLVAVDDGVRGPAPTVPPAAGLMPRSPSTDLRFVGVGVALEGVMLTSGMGSVVRRRKNGREAKKGVLRFF